MTLLHGSARPARARRGPGCGRRSRRLSMNAGPARADGRLHLGTGAELRAATCVAAELLRAESQLETLAAGAHADVIVLDGDPLGGHRAARRSSRAHAAGHPGRCRRPCSAEMRPRRTHASKQRRSAGYARAKSDRLRAHTETERTPLCFDDQGRACAERGVGAGTTCWSPEGSLIPPRGSSAPGGRVKDACRAPLRGRAAPGS